MAQGGPPEGKFPPEIVISEDDPSSGYYSIIMTIPKMKVKSSWKGIKKVNIIDNGTEKIHIKEDEVSVHVKVEHEGTTEEYSYVKKLPEDITTLKSEYKLKKEQVRLILRKKEKNSWGQHSDHFLKRT